MARDMRSIVEILDVENGILDFCSVELTQISYYIAREQREWIIFSVWESHTRAG